MDMQLDTKRSRGVYGPPVGKRAVVFVDDLNMPEIEEYGAQPPVELLRQAIDNGGWYNRSANTFRRLVDVQFVAAMGAAGGGRNTVTPRMLRHLQVVGMVEITPNTMARIFGQILDWHLRVTEEVPVEMQALTGNIIKATGDIYHSAADHLLPTPLKSHYTFNLRDFGRVVQGLLLIRRNALDGDKAKLTRLWAHEVLRVFSDRLVDEADRGWFLAELRDTTKRHFNVSFDTLCGHLDTNGDGKVDRVEEVRGLLFGDFLVADADPRFYNELLDMDELGSVMDTYLEDYNHLTTKPMDLVMFRFAIEHCSRIARILSLPGGNALLVGVGGSGRQSLTRLAAFMGEFDLFQVRLNRF